MISWLLGLTWKAQCLALVLTAPKGSGFRLRKGQKIKKEVSECGISGYFLEWLSNPERRGKLCRGLLWNCCKQWSYSIVFCRNFDPIKNKTLLIPIWFWCKRMSHFGDGGKITLGFIFCKNSYQVRIRADITKVGFPVREKNAGDCQQSYLSLHMTAQLYT